MNLKTKILKASSFKIAMNNFIQEQNHMPLISVLQITNTKAMINGNLFNRSLNGFRFHEPARIRNTRRTKC